MTKTEALEWLENNGACSEGVVWFESRSKTDLKEVIYSLFEDGHFDWANWTLTRLMDRKQRIQYAIFAAEQVLDIFEKEYPQDKRPRNAIEAAKKVLEYDTAENRNAAAYSISSSAASAAYSISSSAASAAYSISSSAASAAYSIFSSSASYTAASSASYAAADDARRKMRITILNYGLELLGEFRLRGLV